MTVGVLGTMVWDRIDHPDGETVERWGGISYSLAAAAAAVPEDWRVRPIVRLGADLADRARAFLESVPGLERPGGVAVVDEPNNRVHLRYRDRHDRDEHLTGGVGPWDWPDLASHLEGLDGLYVNMISGFELEPDTAASLRDRFPGPRYVDLHSLVLDVGQHGRRVPRRPEHPDAWLGSFHVVQANERELAIMAGEGSREELVRSSLQNGARAVVVTRGPDGARWFARGDGRVWRTPGAVGGEPVSHAAGDGPASTFEVRAGDVPLEDGWTAGDPTGCGDVWGATCFAWLMRGRRLTEAMGEANRAAARSVDHRGADGLYQHLRGDA